jgi:hypothetical protein
MIEAADQQMFSSTDGGLSESFCGFRQRTVPVTQYFGRLQFALLYVVLHFLGRNLNSESLAHHSFFTARRLLLGWAEIFQTHRCYLPTMARHMPGPSPGGASSNEFKFDPRGAGKFVGV